MKKAMRAGNPKYSKRLVLIRKSITFVFIPGSFPVQFFTYPNPKHHEEKVHRDIMKQNDLRLINVIRGTKGMSSHSQS